MNKIRKTISLVISAVILAGTVCISGCSKEEDYKSVSGLDKKEKANIIIGIPYETNKALNTVANAFMSKYPNVNIQLQYIEDYDANAVNLFKKNSLDIILQKNVSYTEYMDSNEETGEETPTGYTTDDYYYDFAQDDEIDFSNTTADLTNNYRHTINDKNNNQRTYQYCYPLGGEMRGLFVNVSMLETLGLSVPSNYSEFTDCCEKIKQAGYVPIQGSVSTLSYGVGLAYCANTVVHDSEGYTKMKNAQEGVSQYLSDTLDKIYNLAVNRYFDYKAIENTDYFGDISELGQSRSFLGLKYDKTTFETVKQDNNIGSVAFFPYISSAGSVIDSLISEYDLDTKVKFICTPLNDSGSAPAYITPSYGLCANKNSKDLNWTREFVNFMFREDNMKTYAENASIIPNTSDALEYVAGKYKLNLNTDITLCGQIRFSDSYNGFQPLANWLVTVAKCNAKKYMVSINKDKDGNIVYQKDEKGEEYLLLGNDETKIYKQYIGKEDDNTPGYAFCTKDYFLQSLEKEIAEYRVE